MRKVKMTAIMPSCSAAPMSSASSVGVGSGGSDAKPCHSETPRIRPTAVTPSMPRIAAPGMRRAESAAIAQKPSRASTAGAAVSSLMVTSVAGLPSMISASRSAITPRKIPIPAEIAIFCPRGIASMIQRRMGSTLNVTNSVPDRNTAPSATSQGYPMPSTTP